MVKEREGLTPQSISGLSAIKKKMLTFLSRLVGREEKRGLQEERSTGLFQRPFKGLAAQVGRAGFVTSVIQSRSSDQLGNVSLK